MTIISQQATDINIHGLLISIIKTFLIKFNVRNFISKVARVCKQKISFKSRLNILIYKQESFLMNILILL